MEWKRRGVTRQGQASLIEGSKELLDRSPLGTICRRRESHADRVVGDGDLAGCSEDVRDDSLRLARAIEVRREHGSEI